MQDEIRYQFGIQNHNCNVYSVVEIHERFYGKNSKFRSPWFRGSLLLLAIKIQSNRGDMRKIQVTRDFVEGNDPQYHFFEKKLKTWSRSGGRTHEYTSKYNISPTPTSLGFEKTYLSIFKKL